VLLLLLPFYSNNLNATLSNPALVNALLSLHACGLTVLNLEANNLAGSIPDAFAQLVNLKVLNLGEHWVTEFIHSRAAAYASSSKKSGALSAAANAAASI
jgi:hypothetical protein